MNTPYFAHIAGRYAIMSKTLLVKNVYTYKEKMQYGVLCSYTR